VLYEYRRYVAAPGKMKALNDRFRELTIPTFDRHGIRVMGFWRAAVGMSNELHYIIVWQSLADRAERWTAFLADARWIDGLATSEREGALTISVENQLWEPTEYFPEL
jgi:hypothetical protein